MRKIERRLRLRIKFLEEELQRIRLDREELRDHFVRRFKWWVKLTSTRSTPDLQWLIVDDAKVLRNLDWWLFE